MSAEQRTAVLTKPGGWATAKGALNVIGKKLAGQSWMKINPTTRATYRKAFNPSGAKDDPTDAQLLLDLLMTHPERFKPLTPQSMEMRKLTTLVEQRRGLMDDQRRLTNRLRDALKQYYPQALDWFDHIDTRLFCDFIRRWSTPVQVRRARRATLETFFHEHHVYRAALLERFS